MGVLNWQEILPEKELWEKEWDYITQELIDKRTDYFTVSSAVSGAAPVRATLRASGWLPPT